VFYFNTEPRL